MKICEYCGTKLLTKNPHLVSNHYQYCKVYQQKCDEIKKIVTKEFLIKEHIEGGKSLYFLRRELGLKRKTILVRKLKEFGLKKSLQTDKRQQNHKREISEKTCLKLYGTKSHLSKNSSVRKKIDQDLLTKYGVTNIFQLDAIKKKIKRTSRKRYGTDSPSSSQIVRNKVKTTCTERYGVDNVWKNKDIIEKCKNTKSLNPKAYSPASDVSQKLFFAIYEKLPIELQQHTYFSSLNKEYGQNFDKKYYCYDFVITTVKKCIEFNGDYWHMNPMIFRANDVNTTINKTASEIWDIDKQKQDCLRSRGFEILTIWQQDYKRFPKTIIKKCIKFLIGNNNV